MKSARKMEGQLTDIGMSEGRARLYWGADVGSVVGSAGGSSLSLVGERRADGGRGFWS